MKRSEMKETLRGFVAEFESESNSTIHFPNAFCWKLLDIIEEAGMSPPEYDKVIQSEFVKGGVTTFPTREWEPEDET